MACLFLVCFFSFLSKLLHLLHLLFCCRFQLPPVPLYALHVCHFQSATSKWTPGVKCQPFSGQTTTANNAQIENTTRSPMLIAAKQIDISHVAKGQRYKLVDHLYLSCAAGPSSRPPTYSRVAPASCYTRERRRELCRTPDIQLTMSAYGLRGRLLVKNAGRPR